jgi:predicted DsbA family dithiol-disulfide isomerase
MGINAVPAFVLQEKYLLMGAQPHDVFEQVIAQLESGTVQTDDV